MLQALTLVDGRDREMRVPGANSRWSHPRPLSLAWLCRLLMAGLGGAGAFDVSFADAWRSDIEPETGGWRDSCETVRRKISALTRGGAAFWVGITSDGEEGVHRRWNAKYRGLGMTNIAAVYKTSSDAFCRAMEADLVTFYGDAADNLAGGGGGGRSDKKPYIVYVAFQR